MKEETSIELKEEVIHILIYLAHKCRHDTTIQNCISFTLENTQFGTHRLSLEMN